MDESRWKAFTDNELAALIAAYAAATGESAADEEADVWVEMLGEGIRRSLTVMLYGGRVDLNYRHARALADPEA